MQDITTDDCFVGQSLCFAFTCVDCDRQDYCPNVGEGCAKGSLALVDDTELDDIIAQTGQRG